MPDSDRVHAGLPYRYQKTYQQLCEGYMSPAEIAHNSLKPLKKDIQDFGDGPINLIKQVGEQLEEKTSTPIDKLAIDYNAESQNIESCAQRIQGHPRGIAIAERTCEESLQAIQRGEVDQVGTQQIVQKYIENAYDSNFVQGISMVEQHHDNALQETLDQRLKDMQPHLSQGFANMAEQIMQKDSVKSLRVPRRSWVDSPVDIHNNDLLSMGM